MLARVYSLELISYIDRTGQCETRIISDKLIARRENGTYQSGETKIVRQEEIYGVS